MRSLVAKSTGLGSGGPGGFGDSGAGPNALSRSSTDGAAAGLAASSAFGLTFDAGPNAFSKSSTDGAEDDAAGFADIVAVAFAAVGVLLFAALFAR